MIVPESFALLIGYVTWNVRPEAFAFGPVTIRWYGVLFAVLFWAGYFIVRWQYRLEGKDESRLPDLLTWIVAGTVIGARLGHCLFYEPSYYLRHPLEILKIWEGGLASHGGAIGVLIALAWYSRRNADQPFLWLLDRIVVPTALGGCLIRIGNLLNSEVLGKPTDMPWAFVFTRVDFVPRHPVQLYEAVAYASVFVTLLILYRRWQANTPWGLLSGLFLIGVFTARFIIEFFKEEQADYGADLPLRVGQWLSLPFLAAGVLLCIRALRRSGKS